MTQAQIFLAELKHEATATRAHLERVPMDKLDWQPHAKSMTLGRLATHVAENPSWFQTTLIQDELDFTKSTYVPPVVKTNEELLSLLDQNLKQAEEVLSTFPDERMSEMWTMRNGEEIFFTLPKNRVVRTWCLNHWYHHRAQLGVFLRLLDIAVPGTYGPSADTMEMEQAEAEA